jgi:hypothetical protein
MSKAVIRGGIALVGSLLIEAIGLVLGVFNLDEHSTTGPMEGGHYTSFPNWLYLVIPVLAGLFAFLWTLYKERTGRE